MSIILRNHLIPSLLTSNPGQGQGVLIVIIPADFLCSKNYAWLWASLMSYMKLQYHKLPVLELRKDKIKFKPNRRSNHVVIILFTYSHQSTALYSVAIKQTFKTFFSLKFLLWTTAFRVNHTKFKDKSNAILMRKLRFTFYIHPVHHLISNLAVPVLCYILNEHVHEVFLSPQGSMLKL